MSSVWTRMGCRYSSGHGSGGRVPGETHVTRTSHHEQVTILVSSSVGSVEAAIIQSISGALFGPS